MDDLFDIFSAVRLVDDLCGLRLLLQLHFFVGLMTGLDLVVKAERAYDKARDNARADQCVTRRLALDDFRLIVRRLCVLLGHGERS
ncbi:hypothetical protein [Paraburkholderia sp. GAS334]|uniref:hypothetical protein n=1 Tax=Paraburkholderia sp. GAS334 TaxID=3035131 RepID=UPI003D1BA5C2